MPVDIRRVVLAAVQAALEDEKPKKKGLSAGRAVAVGAALAIGALAIVGATSASVTGASIVMPARACGPETMRVA